MRVRNGVCLGLVLLGVAAVAGAAQTRAHIDHEALWTMPRVAAPAISPDGTQAVATVTEPGLGGEKSRNSLWLLDTAGRRAPVRIASGTGGEGSPEFSPDGRQLLFQARRSGDEAAQLYRLDLAGGDAERLTDLVSGARSAKWSPDGRQLLFVSDVYPGVTGNAAQKEAVDARAERDYDMRVYDGFPIRNWDRWIPETRPQLFVKSLEGGEAVNLLAGSELVAAPGFAGRGGLGSEELEPVWAPDGRSVIFVASSNRDQAAHAFTNLDLWQVELESRKLRRLTGKAGKNAADSYMQPRFSADGRSLIALLYPGSERPYSAARLVRFDWPEMKQREVLELPEALSVSSFALADEHGDTVWLSAGREGQEVVHEMRFGEDDARLAAAPRRGQYSALVAAGTAGSMQLLGLYQSATEPPEVVRIDPRRGRHHALTGFAAKKAAALDLAPLESFWSERDGRRFQSFLLRPPGFDAKKKYPLLVLMHGGPHSMWSDAWVLRWNYHLLAEPGYVVLLTNYTGSTGYGEAFARAIQGDPLEGPAKDINLAADDAIERFDFIDVQRQCAAGASYGGHLANWMQAVTGRYRCLVSHAGLVNLESQWGTSDVIYSREVSNGGPPWELGEIWSTQNPIRHAANFGTPVLVTIGEKDFRVPLNNTLEYWSALQRQQVESRLLVFPEANHWIMRPGDSREFYREVHDWLARWLKD